MKYVVFLLLLLLNDLDENYVLCLYPKEQRAECRLENAVQYSLCWLDYHCLYESVPTVAVFVKLTTTYTCPTWLWNSSSSISAGFDVARARIFDRESFGCEACEERV